VVSRTEQALLAAVIAEPEADLPRLAFADWCEEHGDDARAEIIRVQVEMARLGDPDPPGCGGCFCEVTAGGQALHRGCRPHRLRRQQGQAWGKAWPDLLRPLRASMFNGGFTAVDERQAGRLLCGQGPSSVEFRWRRGFVAEVALPCAAWLAHGPALVRAAPLEAVTLSDREPVPAPWEGEGGRWWWVRAPNANRPGAVPAPLFRVLRGLPWHSRAATGLAYAGRETARAALSAAALRWARAGLVAAAPPPG
jgi:uncharacterized protein (TIGR02996 family)